ncbi:MAG: amidohydrolase family protein [Polyangiaceae bacterium]|nr:amidohydrolase family protein [Polyangiaceae bacterium]
MLRRNRLPLGPFSISLLLAALATTVACGDDTGTGATAGNGGNGANGGEGGEPPTGGTGGTGAQGGQGGSGGGEGGSGGQGGGTQFEEVTCDVDLTPPASGICGVATDGSGSRLIRGTVLGADALYRNGGVLVSETGVIECVGCDCEATPTGADATVIDCPDGVISPGLINPHDHITYANNAPYDVGTTRYDHRHEWRTGANGMPEINVNSGAAANVVLFAELRFIMSGATSTAGAGGRAGLLRNLDTQNLESLPVQAADSDTFPLDDADGTMHATGCNYGDSPTVENNVAGLSGYLPHIAEGIGPEARNEFVCTSDSAVQNGHDLIEPQTAIVHAVGMKPEDFQVMQQELATVIWSPRSNVSLYGDTARVTMIDAMGVPIALGTDWMPSGSMNILRELHCADELNTTRFDGHFSDLALWRMVTENAAFATGTSQAIGMLKPGYTADISVFNATDRKDFRAVIGAGVEDVVLVMRGGEVLYGDADLLDEGAIGGEACEALPVCGVDKKACVAQDVGGGTTLAAVVAAGEAFYPLFFCNDEVPTDEPSCVPWRSEYPDGVTASDGDGDGIADGDDLCPTVFDPIRPLDGSAQADADGDGVGDSCDACPVTSGQDCEAPLADDVDGDGVINAADNCVDIPNTDQDDADSDDHGDACDACPDDPNPGAAACALTIATVRNPAAPGHPAEGTSVSVSGWVTAVRPDSGGSRGFTIQDSTDPFSAIFVFTGNQSPGVAFGDQVTVTGVYDEYFEYAEITSPTITDVAPPTPIPFAAIEIADTTTLATAATAEPYESMWVSLGAVTITTMNADPGFDYDEFAVSSLGGTALRVNDGYLLAIDNTCPVGSAFTDITGVLDYSFDNYKLEPRSDADIAFVTCDPTP